MLVERIVEKHAAQQKAEKQNNTETDDCNKAVPIMNIKMG